MENGTGIIINETSKALQQEINSYCYNNVNAVCRVCLEKSQPHKEMRNIFEFGDVSSMIMACTTVHVVNGDGLPNTICSKCLTRLHIAWQFKTQCENSDAKLRQFYFGNSEQVAFPSSIIDFNYGVKEEEELCLLKKDLERKRGTFNNCLDIVTNQDDDLLSDLKCDSNRLKTGNVRLLLKQLKLDKKQPKTHQCETCGKTFNRRGYLTQHMRIHTGEKPYRCHLCEKRFVNSGHLTTHMRTHTGERPHPCTLCPKAFSTKQELHKHIMVHKGERPFVCKMCGKRFGSSSNLYSHIKHHTGERNYTCEHCGKAFFTKQELKQHLVVHTGEKAFLCEYCNRRFSQISHLKRHSKLHK